MARYSLDRGAVNISINGVNTNGAGDEFAIVSTNRQAPEAILSWQVIVSGGTYTSININLEGSLDGTNWFTLDSSTAIAGELRHVANKKVRFVRANKTASVTNTGTPVPTVSILE